MAARRRRTCWRRPRAGSSDWKKSENWAERSILVTISQPTGSRQSEAIFVWCRRFGDIAVNRVSNLSPRWALVLLAASALTLAGCARKAPLDLPPTGTKDQQVTNTTVPPPTDTEQQRNATPSVFNPGYGSDAP